MNTTIESANSSGGLRKRPWAALGVLGVAALAVAAAMVHVKTRPVEPHLVVLPDAQSTISETAAPASSSDTVKNGKSVAPR
jgi:hypothetical protein